MVDNWSFIELETRSLRSGHFTPFTVKWNTREHSHLYYYVTQGLYIIKFVTIDDRGQEYKSTSVKTFHLICTDIKKMIRTVTDHLRLRGGELRLDYNH